MASVTFVQVGSQPYEGMALSAGLVEGHPVDIIYLKFDRPPEEPTMILLRRDEALSIIWLLSGALWSESQQSKPWVVEHDGYEFCGVCGTALGAEEA